MRIPKAVTPLFAEYKTMSEILHLIRHADIYQITMEEFVKLAMHVSHGFMNPNRAKQIYLDLMEEAGLPPLYKDKE